MAKPPRGSHLYQFRWNRKSHSRPPCKICPRGRREWLILQLIHGRPTAVGHGFQIPNDPAAVTIQIQVAASVRFLSCIDVVPLSAVPTVPTLAKGIVARVRRLKTSNARNWDSVIAAGEPALELFIVSVRGAGRLWAHLWLDPMQQRPPSAMRSPWRPWPQSVGRKLNEVTIITFPR